MRCNECDAEMIIDEWSGWIWFCCHCGHEGRKATSKEIEEMEE